jgi:osmotically-inducible protein OsmY
LVRIISILLICFQLSSCGLATSLGAIAGNASTSTRGVSGKISDGYLLSKVKACLTKLNFSNFSNITVSVLHGKVLLIGKVDNSDLRLKIIQKVWEIDGVKEIFNEIEIGRQSSFISKAEDIIFETKIENRILFEPGIYSNNYSIEVVSGNVYVIGVASSIEEKNKLENFLEGMGDIKKLIFLVDLQKKDEK